jgi:hypothetical protein
MELFPFLLLFVVALALVNIGASVMENHIRLAVGPGPVQAG